MTKVLEFLDQPTISGEYVLHPTNSYSRDVTVIIKDGYLYYKGKEHGADWFRCSAQPGKWKIHAKAN